jgi:ubiquinone/menaquinone biosynthesis C-methylase UbiE
MSKKSTGERLEFYEFSDVTVEHLHRYAIANDFIEGKIVLDIASGEGYGSNILAQKALEVFGVDIDVESVKSANKKYIKNNLKYILGSADNIPIESNSIDVVVSFETIEHHDKHEEMFMEIKRVLKNDGILIMSSPDKKYYSDIPNFKNKFHTKELYFEEFKFLSQKHFQNTFFYFQKAYNLNSYLSDYDFFENMVVYSGDNNDIFKNKNEPIYNLVIASDNQLNKIRPSIFNGIGISDLLIKNIIDSNTKLYKNSTSYKIGNFLCSPFFIFKKVFKYKNN